MRTPFTVPVTLLAALLFGCSSTSSTSPTGPQGEKPASGCNATVPATSAPTNPVYTVVGDGRPLSFAMKPFPTSVCPGGTVVVEVKATNSGAAIAAFENRVIMGCGGPPEVEVARIGPIDFPANSTTKFVFTFTVPAWEPSRCGFSVYGFPKSTDITVLAPSP